LDRFILMINETATAIFSVVHWSRPSFWSYLNYWKWSITSRQKVINEHSCVNCYVYWFKKRRVIPSLDAFVSLVHFLLFLFYFVRFFNLRTGCFKKLQPFQSVLTFFKCKSDLHKSCNVELIMI
jgi:hypothetical protein